MPELTHKAAVRRVVNWLRNTRSCSVVLAELTTAISETPDALGFYGNGGSILIEVKVSRSDFLADKNKWFRSHEEQGVGNLRYFAAPKGLLKKEEIPEGWGLLEIHEHSIREVKEPVHQTANKQNEVKMLMSVLRRLEISTAVFVRAEENNNETVEFSGNHIGQPSALP
jgi:hypothetical protein